MAELGLIAAVVQVVDVGIRLSERLYTFGQTVASADETIVFISKDISHTCSILETLQRSLEKDREDNLHSQNAVDTANTIVRECLEIFNEMDGALLRKITRMGLDGGSTRAAVVALERLKWPFLKPKIMLLWSNLDKLKSSLQLLLNVFIYARLLVGQTDDPSIANDQRNKIEHLLSTTAEQSRKFETLKVAIDRNENLNVALEATDCHIPETPSLDAVIMPTKVPSKSKSRSKTKDTSEVLEVDPATATLEDYCTLIQRLFIEVEAKDYNIGYEMRCRMRDDVVHTHKRETQLLRAVHGCTEVKEKMREKSQRLVEMAEDEVEEGTQTQMEKRVQNSSEAVFDHSGICGPQSSNPSTSHSSQHGGIQKHLGGFEQRPENGHMYTMDQSRFLPFYPPIFIFLDSFEDPWNTFNLSFQTPNVKEPKPTEEIGWLPSWVSGTSKLGLHKISPLKSLISYTQSSHLPLLPFLRSGTSMLVTDKSHIVGTIASSQDLAALTDSTDTDSFVSAQSEIAERALDSQPLCLIVGESEGSLIENGDQGYDKPVVEDCSILEAKPLIVEDRSRLGAKTPMLQTNSPH